MQATIGLNQLTVSKDQAIYRMYALLEMVRTHGVAIIPEFLTAPEVQVIVGELERAFDQEPPVAYPFGRSMRLAEPRVIAPKYPNIAKIFASPFMTNLAGFFFQAPHTVNAEIHVTHETRSDQGLAGNAHLHFDRLHTFKFFFYLFDTDRHCGAFSCLPGSHHEGKRLRELSWKADGDYANVKNRILRDHQNLGLDEKSAVPIEGPRGTLILLDTDTFHMGGVVEPGRERLVLRGHCRKQA